MREMIDRARAALFMERFGRALKRPAEIYLCGGVSAVIVGWRDTTIDIDCKVEPPVDAYAIIAELKKSLRLNVEFASPDLFIPFLPAWRSRCPEIATFGHAVFRHFDFYSQALAKIERGFTRDLADVRAMIERKLVDPARLVRFHADIERDMIRYPAIDPPTFRAAVERFVKA